MRSASLRGLTAAPAIRGDTRQEIDMTRYAVIAPCGRIVPFDFSREANPPVPIPMEPGESLALIASSREDAERKWIHREESRQPTGVE